MYVPTALTWFSYLLVCTKASILRIQLGNSNKVSVGPACRSPLLHLEPRLENKCHINQTLNAGLGGFADSETWVNVAHCVSSCGPTAEMALRADLREAEWKGLGEKSSRIANTGTQHMIFRHACSFSRSFPAPHTSSAAVPCNLTTARDLTRTPPPHYNIQESTEEEPVYKSMLSGRSYH